MPTTTIDNLKSRFFKALKSGDLKRAKIVLEGNPELVLSRDSNGWTPLHIAVGNGQMEGATLLLASGADVNAKGQDGNTPLHSAALKGHGSIVELLLANKADVHAKDIIDETPLHDAAAAGHTSVARLLLANHADVNAKNHIDSTPLHTAAAAGHTGVARLLLANHADVNGVAGGGWVPLHYAAYEGRVEMVTLLLANHAKVNTKSYKGETPLDVAALHGHTGVAQLLGQHRGSAQPEARDTEKAPPGHGFWKRLFGGAPTSPKEAKEPKKTVGTASERTKAQPGTTRQPSAAPSRVASSADAAELSRDFIIAFSKHLDRVNASSDQWKQFVHEYLSPEIVADLAVGAGEKMSLSRLDGTEHSFSRGDDKVLYFIYTLPLEYGRARDHFVKKYGGYTEFLGRIVQLPLHQNSQVVCQIIYCQPASGVPWVNASIFRARGDEFSHLPFGIAVDLLTEQERHKLKG